ncbi:MAG: hypothetical protein ABIR04_02635 [Cypionkella sp.]
MNPYVYRLLSMDRGKKRVLQVAVDVLLLPIMFILAMWLKLDGFGFLRDPQVWLVLIPVLPATIYTFVRLGFYRAVLRYIAGRALITILMGSMISAVTMTIVAQLADLPVPGAVPLIYMLLTFFSVGGVRFGFRELVNYAQNRRKERVAIYGAGRQGGSCCRCYISAATMFRWPSSTIQRKRRAPMLAA